MVLATTSPASNSGSQSTEFRCIPKDICPIQSSGAEQWLQRRPEAGSSWPSSEKKHGLSSEQFPVSAYVGSSKNLKGLKA